MLTWLLALLVLLIVVAGMAVGVMAGRKPIAGSCGGLANVGLDTACACGSSTPGKCRAGAGNADNAQDPAAPRSTH